jgi:alkylation response protein AidB-like acyl-CoA dehydrogenase
MAKLFASEAAHRAADKAMQILASRGYRRGSVVERLFRDVRATEIYQGTSEVQRMVIAEHVIEGAPRAEARGAVALRLDDGAR